MDIIKYLEEILSDIYESIDKCIKQKLVNDIKLVKKMISDITDKYEILTNELINEKEKENEELDDILKANQIMINNMKYAYNNMIDMNKDMYIYKLSKLYIENNNQIMINIDDQNEIDVIRDEIKFESMDIEVINNLVNEDEKLDDSTDMKYYRNSYILKSNEIELIKDIIGYLLKYVGLENYIVYEIIDDQNNRMYYTLIYKQQKFRLKKYMSKLIDNNVINKTVKEKYDYLLDMKGNYINI